MNKQIIENLKMAMDEVASYGCVSKIDGVSVPVIMAQAAAEIERLERECKKAVAIQGDYENQLSDATAQIFDKVSCIENLKGQINTNNDALVVALKLISKYGIVKTGNDFFDISDFELSTGVIIERNNHILNSGERHIVDVDSISEYASHIMYHTSDPHIQHFVNQIIAHCKGVENERGTTS